MDGALEAALEDSSDAELPEIQISYPQGQFLQTLVTAMRARRVLEIGTLGGFSTIFLARGLPEDGLVTTLELEPNHAAVARTNVRDAGLENQVIIIEGDARASLARLISESHEPFDFVFIDADKSGYPSYIESIMELTKPGSLIVADNIVRNGEVLDEESSDPDVVGVRSYNDFVASHPRLSGTVLQTVGSKGYDGIGIAVVVAHPVD